MSIKETSIATSTPIPTYTPVVDLCAEITGHGGRRRPNSRVNVLTPKGLNEISFVEQRWPGTDNMHHTTTAGSDPFIIRIFTSDSGLATLDTKTPPDTFCSVMAVLSMTSTSSKCVAVTLISLK